MLSSLVIHPDLNLRSAIRKILETFSIKAILEGSLSAGLDRMRFSEGLDVVLLSLRFEKNMISNWIKVGKATINGRYCVYGALVSKENRVESGFSSFINQNFDVDFSENLTIESFNAYKPTLDRIVKEKKDLKKIDFLTSQFGRIIEIVDSLASLAQENRDIKVNYNWRFLENIRTQISEASPLVKSEYIDGLRTYLIKRSGEVKVVNSPKPNQKYIIRKIN